MFWVAVQVNNGKGNNKRDGVGVRISTSDEDVYGVKLWATDLFWGTVILHPDEEGSWGGGLHNSKFKVISNLRCGKILFDSNWYSSVIHKKGNRACMYSQAVRHSVAKGELGTWAMSSLCTCHWGSINDLYTKH